MKNNFKTKVSNALERSDNYDDLASNQIRSKDGGDSLRKENKELQFVLGRYNFILNEYQLKYGSELFHELERTLNMEAIESDQLGEFKRILIENVSLIKEYEKHILEKDKTIEFYITELNRLQSDTEKLIEENKELREGLESAKEYI